MPPIPDRHLERFRADPADRRAFEALEEHLFVDGDWDTLVELYQHRLTGSDLAAAPRERARLLLRLGQIWAERRDDADRASDCYRQAVEVDPACRAAFTELRRLHTGRGQWDVALQIADAEAALEMSTEERAALLAEAGTIWLDQLLEPEQALAHFRKALEQEPNHEMALDGAARAAHILGRAREAAGLWSRLADQLRGPPRAAALVAQAGLFTSVGEEQQAGELYRRAHTEDPRNRDALDALAAFAEANEQWSLLRDLHERRFELAEEPAQRAGIALEAGRVELDHLGDSKAARIWFRRAVELDSEEPTLYRSLADAARQMDDTAGLVEALEHQIARSGERPPVSGLLELAGLLSDAGREEPALEALWRALSLAPADTLVLEALTDVLTHLGRHEELADCLERRAALSVTDPETCAGVLTQLGAVQEQRLDDVEAARRSYERAMQADPTRPDATAALERIYRKTEAWGPLRGLLEQAGRGGPTQNRAESLCALGELLREHFDEGEGAARAFDAALALDASLVAAHRGRQRLAAESGDPDAVLAAYENEAAATTDPGRLGFLVREIAQLHRVREQPSAALTWAQRWIAAAPEDVAALRLGAELHECLGHSGKLLELLERLDPLLQSGEQAINRRRMGSLHAAEGRRDEAVTAFRSAIDIDPSDAEAWEGLVAELEEEGRPEELASARQSLAELLPPPRRAACLDALARLLEDRLGDLPAAVDALSRLADTEGAPDDVEERLEALLERTARYEELAARLAQRAAAQPPQSTEARELVLRRAAVLLEHLSEFEASIAAYRQVAASHPDSTDARAGLERGLRAAGDTAGLADFLLEQMSSHPDSAGRDGFAFERAMILEETPDGAEEAASLYRKLASGAEDAEERDRAARRLEALLEHAGDWPGLRAHWESALERVDEAEAAELHARLGRLCRDRLEDSGAALHHFEAVARADAARPEVWQALAELYDDSEHVADLVRALEGELSTGVEPERELALRSRLAQLCAEVEGDPERALPHYQRILELEPGSSAAGEFLIGHWESRGRLDQVVRVLELRLGALDGRDRDGPWLSERTSLRVRIAGLRAGELDDPDGAIAILEPALGEIGAQPVVAEPLADLYQRAGYSEDLMELCHRAAESSEAGAERAAWFRRLGAALRGRGELREAAQAWRRALDEQPDDGESKAALRDLYRKLGDAAPLAHLLEAELSDLAGPEEIPVRMELARLLTGPLGGPGDALLHLRRVVHIDPGHAEALDRGLELAEQLDRRELMQELLDDALRRPQPSSARAALLTRRGRLRSPGDPTQAAADYREALCLEPTRNDVREALCSLLETEGDWEGLLDCLYQQACNADEPERGPLYRRAADIAWRQLGPEAARPWLERLQRASPDDAEVVARLAELHARAGRPVAQLRALERQTQLAREELTRRDLLLVRAHLLEHELAAPGRAAATLEQARSLRPSDTEVLHELDRLYRTLGRHRDRADALEALAAASRANDRVSLLCEAASLHQNALADAGRAAQLLLRAVAETPRTSALHAELLRMLGEALRRAGPPDAWARCAEAELTALDSNASVFQERRLQLRRELAESYETAGRLDAALRHLRSLADTAPAEIDASGELEQALLRGLRAQANWVELERRLATHLERNPENPEGWLELARLREEKLAAPSAAARAYRRVLELDGSCMTALRGLRAVAERLGDWEEVARTLDLELEHPDTRRPAARSALFRRLGDICWERLQSTTRASRSYAAALEARPDDFGAHRSLERLMEAMEDWPGALDLYESEVEVLGDRDAERSQSAWLRAGEIARDHTRELERARLAYVNAAALGPLPAERRAELASLHDVCGEREAFAQVFASWCDDPGVDASARDHLRLAVTLEDLGRGEEALARIQRALEVDPERADAWDAAARLHEAAQRPAEAAAALERAAELAADGAASERLLRAAALREPDDAAAAETLLRQAARSDPASPRVQAALALLCVRRDAQPEAEEAAARALDLSAGAQGVSDEERLELALIGGRAALAQGRAAAASDFFEAALEIRPDHPEALSRAGEALVATGDLTRAREVLETRLAADEDDPAGAWHHALLARCLEAAGEPEAALEHCAAAIAADPGQSDAHSLCVAIHEAAERVDPGCSALERWADAETDASRRADHLERAGSWALRAGERREAAEALLRGALDADPGRPSACARLAALLWESERSEEALEVATLGLDGAREPQHRSELALLRARVLERRGERAEAALAYGLAAETGPRCVEAAIGRARLLRGGGDWRGAAEGLEAFAARSPGDDPHALAEVLQQLGRLRAGPLEDLSGAIEVYRRAVELEPGQVELRATLAQLLSHQPDAWDEALDHHRSALERDPLHAGSLRAALRIAQQREQQETVTNGLALLRALGVASPEEAERAPARLSLAIATGTGLHDELGEALRQAVQKVSREIGEALEAPEEPSAETGADTLAAFRAAALRAEARLSAPGLLPLPTQELAETLTCVATLALDGEDVQTSGSRLNALSEALGRRARRRVRRALESRTVADVQALDFAAWRADLRALAAAAAVDETDCGLRTALVALVCEHPDRSPQELPETTDLTPLVAACPEARSLMRHAIRAWLAEI